jgi:hypothetical protein
VRYGTTKGAACASRTSLLNAAKCTCSRTSTCLHRHTLTGTRLHSARTLETLREADAANTNDVTTTDFGKTWKRLLTQKFGDLILVPCKRFGARISKVAIVHGSTALATRTRRVIFPWYLGYHIHYDHSDIVMNRTCSTLTEQQTTIAEQYPNNIGIDRTTTASTEQYLYTSEQVRQVPNSFHNAHRTSSALQQYIYQTYSYDLS